MIPVLKGIWEASRVVGAVFGGVKGLAIHLKYENQWRKEKGYTATLFGNPGLQGFRGAASVFMGLALGNVWPVTLSAAFIAMHFKETKELGNDVFYWPSEQ